MADFATNNKSTELCNLNEMYPVSLFNVVFLKLTRCDVKKPVKAFLLACQSLSQDQGVAISQLESHKTCKAYKYLLFMFPKYCVFLRKYIWKTGLIFAR